MFFPYDRFVSGSLRSLPHLSSNSLANTSASLAVSTGSRSSAERSASFIENEAAGSASTSSMVSLGTLFSEDSAVILPSPPHGAALFSVEASVVSGSQRSKPRLRHSSLLLQMTQEPAIPHRR